MKNLRIKAVLFVSISSFFSCAGFMDEATILGAEYAGVDRVEITITGDWTDYSFSSGFIYIYGETSDTNYYIQDVLDPPGWRFTDQSHDFRATVYPQFKSGDRVLIFGVNGVLGGTEFTVPE
jgi:hypothetical protein